MIKSKFLAVGVMSGTSMDGIDISLILSDGKKSYKHIKSKFYSYKQSTKTTLSKLVDSFTVSKHSLALLRGAEELVTFEYIAALKKFLKYENLSILIDTSPDIKSQFLKNKIKSLDAIIYTHEHADQTSGIFEMRPFFWKNKKKIPVYGSERTIKALKSKYTFCFVPKHGYVPIIYLIEV